MKIISWNVNGIRVCLKKGLLGFMRKEDADVFCFFEVKALPEDIPLLLDDYTAFHSVAEKKGYSGVSVYSKVMPLSVKYGLDDEDIDKEGRAVTLAFSDFYLVGVYFPHAHRELKRLDFKLRFNEVFLNYCRKLEKKKPVVIASDFNVAHKEIDLANPKQNEKNAGFTVEEREWFDNFLKQGYIDTFREFSSEEGNYTWWTYRNNARQRNIGWRIDYFVVSKALKDRIKRGFILSDVFGSDHCPIGLEI
jgi:exodeoxyribonuclease III